MGLGLGEGGGVGANTTLQLKKLDEEALRAFRDRFNIPVSDAELKDVPYCKPEPGSIEMEYLMERRAKLGGSLPQRRTSAPKLKTPELDAFKTQLQGSGEREQSTTMALVRMLTTLVKDKGIGKHIVPIVPDEASCVLSVRESVVERVAEQVVGVEFTEVVLTEVEARPPVVHFVVYNPRHRGNMGVPRVIHLVAVAVVARVHHQPFHLCRGPLNRL